MPRFVPALAGAAIVLVVAVVAAGVYFNGTGVGVKPSPTPSASPSTRPEGIFADVGDWIAIGTADAIWAVDPTRRGNPDGWVQLSATRGTPEAWSPEGSKLLVVSDLRDTEHPDNALLLVLNADGTETRLAEVERLSGVDFTPDGSQVVYGDKDNIYVIDADGGTPELLLVGNPPLWTFSPDGTQIAYIDWGHGDGGHSVRVMNRDGSGIRVVVEDSLDMGAGHIRDFRLTWAPDGQQLVFANTQGVFVVRPDGSGLRKASEEEIELLWSQSEVRLSPR